MIKILFIIFLLLSGCLEAHACLGPFSETQTYLIELPEDALNREIVAQVKILDVTNDKAYPYKKASKARVLKAIKGVQVNDTLTIISETHSCARDANINSGSYFIAGSIDKNGFFTGTWKGLPLENRPGWLSTL